MAAGHDCRNSRELTSWSTTVGREHTGNGVSLEISKPIYSRVPLPARPHFLSLLKQYHQLGTKYWNLRAYEGNSHSNHHTKHGPTSCLSHIRGSPSVILSVRTFPRLRLSPTWLSDDFTSPSIFLPILTIFLDVLQALKDFNYHMKHIITFSQS